MFWLIKGQLGGRSGPNFDSWDEAALKAGGIGAVLSVNAGEMVEPSKLRDAGIEHLIVPLAAQAPPMEGDLELCLQRLPIAFDFALAQINLHRPVLVHCRHGKDRTGLFMSYFLTQQAGMSPEQAISRVKAVRPIALTAQGWGEFALQVLHAVKQQ